VPKVLISALKIALALATIILSARITYDLQLGEHNIPITGQSLAILCWAVFMRPWESFVAVGLYLGLGVFGLPVFADGASGIEVIKGVSGGFLIGFLIAALVVSWIRDPYRKENILSLLLLMLVGTVIILVSGLIRMSMMIGVDESIQSGLIPFWKGALIKIILGAIISYLIHLIVRAVNKNTKKA